jgi:hypothetical protein
VLSMGTTPNIETAVKPTGFSRGSVKRKKLTMANDILPKDHGIVAASWQLEAADRLTAVILPLTGGWVSGDPRGNPSAGKLSVGFKDGDRIFLKQEWTREDNFYIQMSEDPNDVQRWHGEAETMPPEAAQHWFEVKGARVTQMNDISLKEMRDSFLFDDLFDFLGTAKERWNTTHPDHPWDSSRCVVVLSVEAP